MRVTKFRGFHADEHGETVIKIDGKEIRGLWIEGDLKQYDGLNYKDRERAYCRYCNKYLGNILTNKMGKEAEAALKEREK